MKLKIEFGFGVEYRGDGSGILWHEQATGISKITTLATKLFGGHARVYTFGEWKDPDTNQVVAEQGCTVSVLVDDSKVKWSLKLDEDIAAMVQQIKDSLQQKAVSVTRQIVQFDIL